MLGESAQIGTAAVSRAAIDPQLIAPEVWVYACMYMAAALPFPPLTLKHPNIYRTSPWYYYILKAGCEVSAATHHDQHPSKSPHLLHRCGVRRHLRSGRKILRLSIFSGASHSLDNAILTTFPLHEYTAIT